MIERVAIFRSLSDNHIHLICREGEFKELPDHVRHQVRAGDAAWKIRN